MTDERPSAWERFEYARFLAMPVIVSAAIGALADEMIYDEWVDGALIGGALGAGYRLATLAFVWLLTRPFVAAGRDD